MKKNRKKAETYRFNGSPYLHSLSIHSVEMADLDCYITKFEAKLANPNDADDKKWVSRWLTRFKKEFDKKRTARSRNQRDKRVRRQSANELLW